MIPEPVPIHGGAPPGHERPPATGRHKVFLGMAAGVGKTYRMLQEGRAEAQDGRDVVIGYLEPHGRAETLAQADGLEVVPRREVAYRETTLSELDLPGILARHPQLCLIDELAHTNAPGGEHAKRYEDVAAVLAAGIDVYSTVNVQHLESLNDQVADLTGTRVRETLPDAVLAAADDVQLLDITPELLRERLRSGRVYPAERIESALANFFALPNLTALREISLRQVAEEIDARRNPAGGVPDAESTEARRRGGRLVDTNVPSAIGERLLALVTPRPRAQRIVRRAWRSAARLGAELDVLWVSPGAPTHTQDEQLRALGKLCSVLGAHLLIETGDDVARVAARVAEQRGTTYVLMGRPGARSAWRRAVTPALPAQLMRALPGVDLRIIADRTQRRSEAYRGGQP
jgi:two-component system sensor histidine kinase KdpD